MPTRLIREGFLDSDKIDTLSNGAEIFFVRLMLCADDYGRFDGRSLIIKNRAYPLKDKLTIKKIDEWMTECIKKGLIIRYMVKDKPYIEIIDFKQRLRSKKSKYPDSDGHMTDICPTDDSHVQATNNHLSEEKRSEEKGSELPPPAKNEIWDAVCEIWSLDPKTKAEKKSLGAVVRDLKLKQATRDRLIKLVSEHKRIWPEVSCTYRSVLKNYDFLKNSFKGYQPKKVQP
jgi:hypothetical protein